MPTNPTGRLRSRDIVLFYRQYARLTEMQLAAVQADMKKSVSEILQAVEAVNLSTQIRKEEAEAALIETHLNPDAETATALAQTQDAVDALIESMAGGSLPEETTGPSRVGAKFSKTVEAISGLHSGLSQPLVNIMGVLSYEDVVGQRLSHITSTMNHLSEELGHLVGGLNQPISQDAVEAFRHSLLTFSLSQYTITEEKQLFYKYYPKNDRGTVTPTSGENVAGIVGILNFLAVFLKLLEDQLTAVSENISSTVSEAMATILSIGSISDERKKHADTMLIRNKEGSSDQFVAASIEEAERNEQPHTTSSEKLGQSSSMMSALENELNEQILRMMGELSIDDVVGQRLEHVIASFDDLLIFTNEVVSQLSAHPGPDINPMTQDFLKKIHRSYTMESEKACFQEVFGPLQLKVTA